MMWIGFKPFKITNIKQESEDIKSFTVETEEYDFSENYTRPIHRGSIFTK